MPKKPSKQVRVLYTNGNYTYVIHSLTHTGTDLYHRLPGGNKSSYHQSGIKHTKTKDGKYLDRNKEIPLSEVPFRQLCSQGFHNTARHFADNTFEKYSGNKADSCLIIDSRSIPENAFVEINIGIIAPDNLGMLYNMLNIYKLLPGLSRKPQQVLLYTATPWIYTILYH